MSDNLHIHKITETIMFLKKLKYKCCFPNLIYSVHISASNLLLLLIKMYLQLKHIIQRKYVL